MECEGIEKAPESRSILSFDLLHKCVELESYNTRKFAILGFETLAIHGEKLNNMPK